MRLLLNTNEQPLMLATRVDAPMGTPVTVSVRDLRFPDTFYSKATGVVNTTHPVFFTRLPLSPEKAEFTVQGGKVLEVKHYPLYTNDSVYNNNSDVRSFSKFIQFFVRRKNILHAGAHNDEDAGSWYASDDGKFRLQYVDEIYDWRKMIIDPPTGKSIPNPNYGKPVTSSMQMGASDKRLRIAKKYAYNYTIPEFIAISLHEFAHGFVNTNPADEEEADDNAVEIYSGMGFPRNEGANAFLQVFQRANKARPDSPQDDANVKRMRKILAKLNKMDKKTFKIIGDGQEI